MWRGGVNKFLLHGLASTTLVSKHGRQERPMGLDKEINDLRKIRLDVRPILSIERQLRGLWHLSPP
jgi:hypothetical protein